MKKLEELHAKILENDIMCFDYDIKSTTAAVIEINDKYSIFANFKNFKTKNEEFCALAHEYGHCKSGATHKIYSPLVLIKKNEYKADRCSIMELLPISELKEAAERGCKELWQFADKLELPEDFIKKAISHYRAMGELDW